MCQIQALSQQSFSAFCEEAKTHQRHRKILEPGEVAFTKIQWGATAVFPLVLERLWMVV